MTLYRVEPDGVYFSTVGLLKAMNTAVPIHGGKLRISTIADLLASHNCFPPWLSAEGHERVVRRLIEWGCLRSRGIPVPAWIGLNKETEELLSPPHPEAPPIRDTLTIPPRMGATSKRGT